MNSSFSEAKQRYLRLRQAAYDHAQYELQQVLRKEFRVRDWSGKTASAIADQWGIARHADAGWDWPEIIRRYKGEANSLPLAIWTKTEERLAAVALDLCTRRAVELKFLEADPRSDCPLKGKRVLIALEVAFYYAQALGLQEIRVRPINSKLETLYVEVYGFEVAAPFDQMRYLRKRV